MARNVNPSPHSTIFHNPPPRDPTMSAGAHKEGRTGMWDQQDQPRERAPGGQAGPAAQGWGCGRGWELGRALPLLGLAFGHANLRSRDPGLQFRRVLAEIAPEA